MHHSTYVTAIWSPWPWWASCQIAANHVSWFMPGSLTRGCGENVPGIACACAYCNIMYMARGPQRNSGKWWLTIFVIQNYLSIIKGKYVRYGGKTVHVQSEMLTVFPRYGDPHVKDKTVGGNSYTCKMTSLYRDAFWTAVRATFPLCLI